jgi:hypothetical protein
MNTACDRADCGYERVAEVQFQTICRDIGEMRGRVNALEAKLNAGLALLIGNLMTLLLALAKTMLTSVGN